LSGRLRRVPLRIACWFIFVAELTIATVTSALALVFVSMLRGVVPVPDDPAPRAVPESPESLLLAAQVETFAFATTSL
jgi:hypothetical protein